MPKPLISVGELIDQSWETYRSRIWDYLAISGWLLVSAILFAIALAFYPSASKLQLAGDLTFWESSGVILFSISSLLVTPILSFWVYIALMRGSNTHLTRNGFKPKNALREAKAAFFPTLVTSIMVTLMVILAIVIGFAPPAILAALASLANVTILVIIANLLLFVGMGVALFLTTKWIVYYIFAPYLTALNGLKMKEALATSRAMIQGQFWPVLVRLAIPKIVFMIFGAFAMAIVAYIVGILISASAGLSLDIQLRISTMTEFIVPVVIAAFINPLIVISDVLVLRSLKS